MPMPVAAAAIDKRIRRLEARWRKLKDKSQFIDIDAGGASIPQKGDLTIRRVVTTLSAAFSRA